MVYGDRVTAGDSSGPGARPALIRALNERLILDEVRRVVTASRADLTRATGLSKPTVTLALNNLEREGLIRVAGRRAGVSGPAAALYEIRPTPDTRSPRRRSRVRARRTRGHRRAPAARRHHGGRPRGPDSRERPRRSHWRGRWPARPASRSADVTQTVVGSPGPRPQPGRHHPCPQPARLGSTRGARLPAEGVRVNGGDGERRGRRGHRRAGSRPRPRGRQLRVPVGRHRHRDGPRDRRQAASRRPRRRRRDRLPPDQRRSRTDVKDARRRGPLEAAASAAAMVRAARRSGMPGRAVGPPGVRGRHRWTGTRRRRWWPRRCRSWLAAMCAVVAVATHSWWCSVAGRSGTGFADAVAAQLRAMSPVLPEVRVSALGDDAVVDGCLAEGHGSGLVDPHLERSLSRCCSDSVGLAAVAQRHRRVEQSPGAGVPMAAYRTASVNSSANGRSLAADDP